MVLKSPISRYTSILPSLSQSPLPVVDTSTSGRGNGDHYDDVIVVRKSWSNCVASRDFETVNDSHGGIQHGESSGGIRLKISNNKHLLKPLRLAIFSIQFVDNDNRLQN